MDFNDADSEPLKSWMIKKLSKISDADPDVLADYVLALVKSDEPEAQARANCQESLEDFLEGNTKGFIDDVFTAVKTKSFLPAHLRPKAARPAAADGQARASSTGSGKRSFDQAHGTSLDQNRIQRGNKMARGARGGRGRGTAGAMNGRQVANQPAGMPTFNQNDAAAMMATMQAMMGMQMPALGSNPNAQPCRDFFERGVCYAGMSCPYDHGSQVLSPPTGFGNASSPPFPDFSIPSNHQQSRAKPGVRRGKNGRPLRAPFSQVGPNSNKRNPSIVVEQIPQEHISEESVRGFFSTFGEIESVTMQPESQLAIVTYKEWENAKAAYESPKAVFDNRFVKVYWHRAPAGHAKADQGSSNGHKEEGEPFDKEEFERTQAEAQRKHEEHMKKVETARIAREELDAKVAAHTKALRELKKKVATEASPTRGEDPASNTSNGSTNPQTAALEAQLRALEEEAENLGLPLQDEETHDSITWKAPGQAYQPPYWAPRGRGRGRGRVFAPRGSYRGRGRAGAWTGGSVARLDNRPRNVEVIATDDSIDLNDEEHNEALRTLLFATGDFVAITRHPDHLDSKARVVIKFRERFVAESFISAVQGDGNQIAGIGKCELGWVSNDKVKDAENTVANPTQEKSNGNGDEMEDGQDSDDEQQEEEHKPQAQEVRPDSGHADLRDETDHDVADDEDDRWIR